MNRSIVFGLCRVRVGGNQRAVWTRTLSVTAAAGTRKAIRSVLVVKKPHDGRTTHAAGGIIRYARLPSSFSVLARGGVLMRLWDRYLSSPEFGAPRVIVERSAVQDLAPLGISARGRGDVRVDVLEAREEAGGKGES